MRVISGTKRGLKLYDFEGMDIRPTTDRVKENIFNLITPFVSGARVLDVFGGSGALSIEALSRGAESALILDKAAVSVSLIKKNVEKACFLQKCRIYECDSAAYLKNLREEFDLIFLDPPYASGLMEETLKIIADNGILSRDGVVVCERDFEKDIPLPKGLELFRDRKYGRTQILLYTLKSGDD